MNKEKNKIFGTIVAVVVAFLVCMLIQRLFLNLDYEIIRSAIVAAGVGVWWCNFK